MGSISFPSRAGRFWIQVLLSLSLDATGRTPHWLDPMELVDGKGTLKSRNVHVIGWDFIVIQWDFIVIQWDINGIYPLVMTNI